jgi:hypothetical protein
MHVLVQVVLRVVRTRAAVVEDPQAARIGSGSSLTSTRSSPSAISAPISTLSPNVVPPVRSTPIA